MKNSEKDTTQLRPVPIRPPFPWAQTTNKSWIAGLVALGGVRLTMMALLPFSDTTEARYAEIARKMVETGDWITPQFDYGVPFWGKPPLHTWMSALAMGTAGVSEFNARFPIFLASLFILGLVYYWMKSVKDQAHAVASTAVLASSVLFFGTSGFVMTDIPMSLGVTLCMIGVYLCLTKGNRTWGRLAFFGVAIGLLAKGPVALLICIIPLGLWGMTGKRFTLLKKLPWVSGTIVLLAVSLPWYFLAELKTPGFLRYFVVGEHFERFVVPDWRGDLYGSGHERPKGIIWLYALGAFMPWTLFALAIPFGRIVDAFRNDADGLKSFLLFWILSPLILFTFAANLLAAYALPAMPAAACLGVLLWKETKPASRTFAVSFGLCVAATAGLGAALSTFAAVQPNHPKLRAERALVAALAADAPAANLHYLSGRSYSAEFYRAGEVSSLSHFDDLFGLWQNSIRDAVAVDSNDHAYAILNQSDRYINLGIFGRHALFLEAEISGGKNE